jgi:hypothetical protein
LCAENEKKRWGGKKVHRKDVQVRIDDCLVNLVGLKTDFERLPTVMIVEILGKVLDDLTFVYRKQVREMIEEFNVTVVDGENHVSGRF